MGGKGGADDPQREAGERVGDLLAGVWLVRAEPTGHAQADAADGQGDEGLVVDRERARGLPVAQHLPEQLPGLLQPDLDAERESGTVGTPIEASRCAWSTTTATKNRTARPARSSSAGTT
jgi:hypothetical protein